MPKSEWDTHKKAKKIRKHRPSPVQRRFDNWHRRIDYQPFTPEEGCAALGLPYDRDGVEHLRQCIKTTRDTFRTFAQSELTTTYRVGMVLLDASDQIEREGLYEKMLEKFKNIYLKQPVYYDDETETYQVPEHVWKEINDMKITGRWIRSAVTKLAEAAACNEVFQLDAPMTELLSDAKSLDKKLHSVKELAPIDAESDENTN